MAARTDLASQTAGVLADANTATMVGSVMTVRAVTAVQAARRGRTTTSKVRRLIKVPQSLTRRAKAVA